MIYFLVGNNFKKKNEYIKEMSGNHECIFLTENNVSRELLVNYSTSNPLFGVKTAYYY